MALITLTSDLGLSDPYVATVKGRMLSRCPVAQLVDVSHQIKPFDHQGISYALRQAYPHFPAETIHWIGVDSQLQQPCRSLVIYHLGQYFVGPDDGLFALLFDEHPDFLFAIRDGVASEHGEEGLYADTVFAAAFLAGGGEILQIANQVQDVVSRVSLRAPAGEDFIRATVIHVDRFGNVILNVDRRAFDSVCQGRNFHLRFRRRERIDTLSSHYADVPVGERLCLFNSGGHLEIAINQGDAAALLGLGLDDAVQLVFESVPVILGPAEEPPRP